MSGRIKLADLLSMDLAELTWRAHAACLDAPRGLFFPCKGCREEAAAAKAICATCPVQEECLEYAMSHGAWWGIWGGTSEKERRKLNRERRKVRAAERAAEAARVEKARRAS